MNEYITADPSLQAKLASANGRGVKLCDDSGKIIGYAFTPEQIRRAEIEYARTRLSNEEIEEILASPGKRYSMEDVLKLVEES